MSIACLILLIVRLSSAQNIIDSAIPPSVVFELLALNRDLPTMSNASANLTTREIDDLMEYVLSL